MALQILQIKQDFNFGVHIIVKMDKPCSSKQQKITPPNYEKCILCQELQDAALVGLPDSSTYSIEEIVEYHNSDIYMVAKWLQHETPASLEQNNVTWHIECYREVTSNQKIERSRLRIDKSKTIGYQPKQRDRLRKIPETCTQEDTRTAFLLSNTCPYNKELCFFSQEETTETPYSVRGDSTGIRIRNAIQMSHNDHLKVRLSTAIAQNDSHAIDVKYCKNDGLIMF